MTDDRNSRLAALAPVLSLLARLALAAVWLFAGIPKLLGEAVRNEEAVQAYRILPDQLVPVVAAGQPALEIVLGVLLLVGLSTRLAAAASAVVFVLYIVLIARVWALGLKIDCGCFSAGGADASASWQKYLWDIVRDAGFVLLALWLMVKPKSWAALGPRSKLAFGRAEGDDFSEDESGADSVPLESSPAPAEAGLPKNSATKI